MLPASVDLDNLQMGEKRIPKWCSYGTTWVPEECQTGARQVPGRHRTGTPMFKFGLTLGAHNFHYPQRIPFAAQLKLNSRKMRGTKAVRK